jgi:hypothetical protein
MAAAISPHAQAPPGGAAHTLHNAWSGVDLAADRVAHARLLRLARTATLGGRGTPPVLRDVIVRSWGRCTQAGVDPDRPAPVLLDADSVAARFATHPLSVVVPTLQSLLAPVSADARHLVSLSDADGMLLWVDGHPSMLEAAIAPRFRPGSCVAEAALGTNATGTALALDHAIQVFSAEHYNRLFDGWTGAAAPIHDRRSGAPLGAVGVSGSFRTAHPHTLTLVEAVARAAEAALAQQQQQREAELTARYIERLPSAGRRPSALIADDGRVLCAAPRGWLGRRLRVPVPANGTAELADGTRVTVEPAGHGAVLVWGTRARARCLPRPALHIDALAPRAPRIVLDGRRLSLTARHVELLVVLALAPSGLSAHGLADALYGPGAKAVSVRAEVARLRRRAGDIVLARPYRLTADVSADFIDVERLARNGAVEAAARRYTGALLPVSSAPAIVAARARLEAALMDARIRACPPDAGAASVAWR